MKSMLDVRTWIIVGLAAVVWWFGATIVRLENYRYANQMGFCSSPEFKWPEGMMRREDCLNRTQTRTHSLWHLYL